MVINILLIVATVISFGFLVYGVYLIVTSNFRPDVRDKGLFYASTWGMLFFILALATAISLFII